ncbi:TrkH family potassium uptake protein [Lyngbya sp. CCY1209]|uniref:TrkH family potassium uptake protein n=1 Tax=Lyngbya sp. CCY1209 TaxID=2886103 RepID=UPI002D201C4F|nr:TrkH family potassium uptake protein [Lyngbya sp. CCY1209]MEB3883089.1 TrkH family potassium uptake protein [Lyngbya sp. CCY1209]
MNPYIKTTLRDLGLLLHIPGAMAVISLPVCVIFGEYYALLSFLGTAAISFAIGQGLYRLFKKAEESRLPHALLTVGLGWFLIPCLGSIPFILIASHLSQTPLTPLTIFYFQNPWNALFEAFSGFTSTGLSVALHSSELPNILLWWRSLMEWIGGVGVIVLMISILEPSTDAYQLYSAETRNTKIGLTITETVQKIWKIYLIYTAIAILLLRVAGMSWWHAINHGMTGISTGGFSIPDDSIAAYDTRIQAAVILVMIAGAISFPVHYQLIYKGRLKALWQDSQHRALWILLVVGSLLLFFETYWFHGQFHWLDSVFQWASALGTCGFSTVNLKEWLTVEKLILTVGMIFGGASGSTVGGLKLTRVVSLFKAILWRVQRVTLAPHQMMYYKLDGKVISETQANRRIESAAVLGALWLSAIAISIFILINIVGPEYTLADVIFESASALGSVGLSTGITGPTLPWLGKVILMLLMWMGRLEIVPVLLLISWPLGRFKSQVSRRIRKL